jgi:hypothetical protein
VRHVGQGEGLGDGTRTTGKSKKSSRQSIWLTDLALTR